MRLLMWISVAYAGVLVVALAVSLAWILVCLLRIRAAVVPIAEGLVAVSNRTAPLEGVLMRLDGAVARVQEDVHGAAEEVVRAGAAVGIPPPQPPPIQAGAVARWQERS